MRYIMIVLLIAAGIQLAFSLKEPIIISGFVNDLNGKPVSGATVFLKGTKKFVLTDSMGAFKIEVPGIESVLMVNAVGYETQEWVIKTNSAVLFLLKPVTDGLQEVIVSGHKIKKQQSMTGSVTEIKSDQSTAIRMGGIGTLSGKAAGVTVNQSPAIYGSRSYHDQQIISHEREGYDFISENRFLRTTENPLSTFSIDVDAASYSNVRRFIQNGRLPPEGAVRIEELINYFSYNYPQPVTEDPFAVHAEIAVSPWNSKHKLVMVGLQGKRIPVENLPASNLVFLIDVSGSMQDANKLPLVKASMKLLVSQLREKDRVAIVVYAGAAGLVLPSTSGAEKQKIRDAIERLEAGGSTAGSAGIKLAYATAKENFRMEGNNRVILCTDGDFNVGESSDDALERMITKERKSGIFLTVLGFGMGNYQDAKMQKLADKGNGNHAYIDQLGEAKKVLVNEFGGTLFTIAKDVKLQVEFNPAKVKAYRLVGYENRLLNKEDFNNDKKDAGDMGSGHTVTALYEIIPVGVNSEFTDSVDVLKYQQQVVIVHSATAELMTVKIRYKKPDGEKSKLLVHAVNDTLKGWEGASDNFRFASAVAGYGMLLRKSVFKGSASYPMLIQMVKGAIGKDEQGYRREFRKLLEETALLDNIGSGDEEEVVTIKD